MSSDTLLEGLELDRYRLGKCIGGGGMGQVYIAKDRRMEIDREVAIKATVLPNDVEQAKLVTKLFEREVKAITQLNHPHIVPICDYEIYLKYGMKLACIVMPYYRDGSLADWCKDHSISLTDVAHFVLQAADALQHVHDLKIVHRDIKPQNFLIRKNIDRPYLPDILLTDFGIVKLNSATVSIGNAPSGTPLYMPPEQWDGDPEAASDQYALAIMAYQLLTNTFPFQGNQQQLRDQHKNQIPQPPSIHNKALPVSIDNVVLRALAKRPEERYPSVIEFAKAFQKAVQSLKKGEDIEMLLVISKMEALAGGTYYLKLSGKQQMIVVPGGSQDGQKIKLTSKGKPSEYGGQAGDLIVTVSVKSEPDKEQLLVQHLDNLSKEVGSLPAMFVNGQQRLDNLSRQIRSLSTMSANEQTKSKQFKSNNWPFSSILNIFLTAIIFLTILLIGGNIINSMNGIITNYNTLNRNIADAAATPTASTIATLSNLVTNPGFEVGSFLGWGKTGSTLISSTAHTGNYSAQAGLAQPTAGDSTISQTFTIPSGGSIVSFWYQIHCRDSLKYDWATAMLRDNTIGTISTILARTCNNNARWMQVTANITAGHSYTLTLISHDDDHANDPTYTLFDDVSVS